MKAIFTPAAVLAQRLILATLLLAVNALAYASETLTPQQSADRQWQQAMQLARAGKAFSTSKELSTHPLMVYLEHAVFARQIQRDSYDEATLLRWFKAHQADFPLLPALRKQLLDRLAKAENWSSYIKFYLEAEADSAERCNVWQARMALAPDAKLGQEHALRLYRDHRTSALLCAPAFSFLRERQLTADDANARFAELLKARRISDAKSMLQDIPEAERAHASLLLKAESDAFAFVKQLPIMPKTDDQAEATMRALARIAQSNPQFALQKLTSLAKDSAGKTNNYFNAEQKSQVQGIALRTALIADSPQVLNLLVDYPEAALDESGQEWAIRRILKARDADLLRMQLGKLTPNLAAQSKWLYIQARQLELDKQAAAAGRLYQQAAKEANFYGFLAADRLQTGYALCPDPEVLDPAVVKKLAMRPAMQRLAAFKRMHDRIGAKREWFYMLSLLSSSERRQAGIMAAREGWGEYAILALNQPENRKLYTSRFPILEVDTLNLESKRNGLDPYFIAGLIRQESAWNPEAVSRANARGLMQLLPSTAALTAKSIGIPTNNINLFDPAKNIQLGTSHLTELSQKYANSPILMTAAYNAGPNAVARWLDGLYKEHPDIWIETIPYRETRDYVSTVLAFSVIYDWRIDGQLTRLSNRIPEMAKVQAPVAMACAGAPTHDASGGK